MRGVLKWLEKVELSNVKEEDVGIQSICYKPDGSQIIVAANKRILVYDANDGTLLNTLKSHKDVINCVVYAKDGKKFASGSTDKTVIVWSSQLAGILKYSHGDSVQCMCFNTVSHHLASCSKIDFAFWSPDQKSVQKYKIHVRINACCWTNDGQYLIMGLANGTVTIRNKMGEEKGRIIRPNSPSSAICDIQCCPNIADRNKDFVAVVDTSQILSFYMLSGQLIGKERPLSFDPVCLRYLPNDDYCLIACSTGIIYCYNSEGIRLGILGDASDDFPIKTIAPHPDGQAYTIGCKNGTLSSYFIAVTTIHALYRERYAFREHMCDVIIQHLITKEKVRIKCRDIVQKIAIYKEHLAVQLPERILLYESTYTPNELSSSMHYKVKDKLEKKFDCSLLVVCSQHIVLCQNHKLRCLDFAGILQHEWVMETYIRYIKVIGGPKGREGLMVGLKNGQVYRIFLNNPLPVAITKCTSAVRCLDVNMDRTKIAVVDDGGRLIVRDLHNDTLLYQDTGVNSVSWNTHLNSMLCYTHSAGGLTIRISNLPPRAPQHMLGVVVGLYGATVFCLRGNIMHNVPLGLSATMWQLMETGLFEDAYEVACLGVTNGDWENLARSALEALHLNVAHDAYVKLKNFSWIQLVNDLIEKQKRPGISKEVLLAEIYAYAGKYREAARYYEKCQLTRKSLEMYMDLRMFDIAQEFTHDMDQDEKKAITIKRAEWAYTVNEPRAAVELLLSISEYDRAIEIVAEQEWADVLYDIGRHLNQDDAEHLKIVAQHLKRLKAIPLAAEIFKKLGNKTEVVQLHVEAHDWSEAFNLAKPMPELLPTVYYQHAKWLAENDQFIEAHEAFLKSGHIKDANRLLKHLSSSAIEEERFLDASYFYWLLSKQYLDMYYQKQEQSSIDFHFKEHQHYIHIAKIYYAYSIVYNYMKEPFTTYSPISLFNVSRFILNEVEIKGAPKGVSMFGVLFTLAKQAKLLNAKKLCLIINKRLQSLKPPQGVQEQIDINYLNSKACKTGFNDPEELLPLCYKCSNYSQHLNGNVCPTCKQGYIFSFVSFEILPLVQFYPEVDITDNEAESLLLAPPKAETNKESDIFNEDVASALPLSLDRNALRSIEPNHVLILKRCSQPHSKFIFYRNILPELQITYCPECLTTFYAEDFELHVLQKGYCPFCRTPADKLLKES